MNRGIPKLKEYQRICIRCNNLFYGTKFSKVCYNCCAGKYKLSWYGKVKKDIEKNKNG